jgi:hypothetical protein
MSIYSGSNCTPGKRGGKYTNSELLNYYITAVGITQWDAEGIQKSSGVEVTERRALCDEPALLNHSDVHSVTCTGKHLSDGRSSHSATDNSNAKLRRA